MVPHFECDASDMRASPQVSQQACRTKMSMCFGAYYIDEQNRYAEKESPRSDWMMRA